MSSFPIKVQFFLAYGVLGSLSPIAALVLRDAKGFSPQQFGIALALSSLGLLISPTITSWLADRDVDTRQILRGIFLATAVALTIVFYAESVWSVIAAWTVYNIVFIPTIPLLDGYYFKQERVQATQPDGSYQFVRVWGTVGFLIPSLVLYLILTHTGQIANAIWVTVFWCGLCFVGTFLLKPTPKTSHTRSKAPTLEAAKVLLSRATLPLCIGLFFVHTATTAYYPIFSVFLTDEVGISSEWVAMVLSLGVAIEIGYIFGLGPLRRRLRIRGVIIVGLTAMALRLAALALFPTVTVALAIQLLHGMEILALFLVPVIYLNRVAGDGFRHSIQGVFTVIVVVPTRFIGPLLAGRIREIASTTEVLYTASALSAIGMLIILLFFRPAATPSVGVSENEDSSNDLR